MDGNEKSRFDNFVPWLLDWYEKHARDLPWRIGPKARRAGVRADPYKVWLAEIMLQQTTVAHAVPYYLEFTRRWPDVDQLAAAQDEEIMAAWAGLGYYARARNLLKCARQIHAEQSVWPETVKALQALPGIGPYTAGAIAALAFDQPSIAMDGNVERVFARLLRLDGPWADQKKRIRHMVQTLVPADRPAQFAEALMDLGATVCTPRQPLCHQCPVAAMCQANARSDPHRYPLKPVKKPRPRRFGQVYVVLGPSGEVLTHKRPDKGLLGGMQGLPTSQWQEKDYPEPTYPFEAEWQARTTIAWGL